VGTLGRALLGAPTKHRNPAANTRATILVARGDDLHPHHLMLADAQVFANWVFA
jgi:hypothetical protein